MSLFLLSLHTVRPLSVQYTTFILMKGHQQQPLPMGSSPYEGCGREDKGVLFRQIDREPNRETTEVEIYIYIYNQIDNKIEKYLDTSQYSCSSCFFVQFDLSQNFTPHLI
jgi:hypothetical protein